METVSDMIAGFLAGLTPGTRAQYRSVVSRWLRWCADNAGSSVFFMLEPTFSVFS